VPKIRGFKPDLWTDEDFVEASPYARLLWLGMWNFACDNGHLQDKSKQIKMRVLPTDDVNCAELLRELADLHLIERDDGWITVPNLTHHQKVDRRYFTACDKADCTKPDSKPGNPKRKTRRAPDVSTARPLGDGDGDGELMVKEEPSCDESHTMTTPSRFEEFWIAYDRRGVKKQARDQWAKAVKKTSADLLITAAADYIAWMKAEAKHPTYTVHAHRWLRDERWTDERTKPQTRVQQHLALAQELATQQPDHMQIGDGR
jgi:hypothetical protein